MSYLLDTNVISETIKTRPNENLAKWLDLASVDSLFISVLTLGEIRKGIEKLKDSKKKTNLLLWLENDLNDWFGTKVLAVDKAVADKWGFVCAQSKNSLPVVDSLIAATAITNNLKLVTRNVKDFEQFKGLEVINPF